ncbi:MAG: AAA family ATPase, partial [Candidatus Nanoarchaeia archaeon]
MYIKKLVMQGFKSFPSRTEIPFEGDMNVIVGPNGSGKSNITDALCFVLGRLSIKSIRAAKAAHLLFSGTKSHKPSQQAEVEIIIDNSDESLALKEKEISIKRIVKRNGQSIYKINNETKTRQELLELLAQAGIDPHGFNIVLQGEIASLIKAKPEERRKIIEEVAGISIYESRKQKSLRELEKTEEKLKEVSAVLKEKNNYLKNLEKERQEALNYQKLQETINRCKASLLEKDIKDNERNIENIEKIISQHKEEINKLDKQQAEKQAEIEQLDDKIKQVNKQIQKYTGDEQEALSKAISDLNAELAGLQVRKENFEARIEENKQKQTNLKEKIAQLEKEITESSSPEKQAQKQEHEQIEQKLNTLEKQRKKFYILKSELSSLNNKKQEQVSQIANLKSDIKSLENSISSLYEDIQITNNLDKAINQEQETKARLKEIAIQLEENKNKNIEKQREIAIQGKDIEKDEKLKQDITKLDVCPLCKNKITQEHVKNVIKNANNKT